MPVSTAPPLESTTPAARPVWRRSPCRALEGRSGSQANFQPGLLVTSSESGAHGQNPTWQGAPLCFFWFGFCASPLGQANLASLDEVMLEHMQGTTIIKTLKTLLGKSGHGIT